MANSVTSHYFHAEAHALAGKLNKPFNQEIKKQAFVKLEGNLADLPDEERAERNYFSQHAKNFRLEGIVSYAAAHTQVSGHKSDKHDGASVTLATSVVEDLNVLNVVTADRVVAQISTTHFPNQYSPEVTFLGTHFENLRIARHPTVPAIHLPFAGKPPAGTDAYFPTQATKENGLMASVEALYQKLRDDFAKVKGKLEAEYLRRLDADDSWYSKQYDKFSDFDYEKLQDRAAEAAAPNGPKWEGVTCSLVNHVDIENIEIPVKNAKPIIIPPPAHCFGHVIHVPDFGTIFLAELKVNHNSFDLTMIRLELGCIADGSASVGATKVNGRSGGAGGGGKGGGGD